MKRLGGVEINDQLECRWLLHRQISGLGAVEDLSSVNAELAPRIGEGRSIADQAAGRDEFAPLLHRRNGMA